MAAEVLFLAWRTVRAFALGRGPLKRGSDRVQFAARLVLLLFVLVSVPVALTVGTVVHEQLRATAEQQAAELTRVTAVAVEDAHPTEAAHSGTRFRAMVRWAARDGTTVEARVPAPVSTRAGQSVAVWTTADGHPAAAPMTALEVVRSTVVLVTLGWSWSLVAVGTAYLGLCRLLDQHRDRRWTREWAEIEPTWSRRVP